MNEIGLKIAKGAAWMVLFKILEKSIALISTVILARLLVPQDFGLVAMATSIIFGIELLYAFNFDVALIQKQDATEIHYNTAWSLNVCLGLISVLLLVLIAPQAASFYNEPRLQFVIYVLAVGIIISAIQNIGVVDFRKKMQFRKEFKLLMSKKLVGFSVTISIVLVIQSYWALIVGVLAGKIIATILSYTMHPYRPRFSFDATRDLLNFSIWLLINNILFFLKIRAADFVIGRFLGVRELGLFTIGYEISNLPTTELIAPINRAVFPGYSKMSTDLIALREGFINVLSVILLFALPVGTGIAVSAEKLILVILGEKWIDIIPIIQVLAFFGVLSAAQSNIGSVFLALGRPKVITYLSLLYVVLLIPSLVYAVSNWGMIGAAWTYLIISILTMPLTYYIGLKILKLSLISIFKILWRPLLSSTVMYFVVREYLFLYNNIVAVESIFSNIAGLLSGVLLGALVFIFLILVLRVLANKPFGAETMLLDKMSNSSIGIINKLSTSLV